MAKRKRKKRKSRKTRRRRNPLSRRRRRRNPDLGAVKDRFLGPDLENVKKAAIMALGGGLALGVGTAAFGTRLGAGNVGKGLVAVLSGVVGGLAVDFLGKTIGGDLGQMLQDAAVPGATGAMVLGLWAVAQPVVEPIAGNINAKLGFAGWLGDFGQGASGGVLDMIGGKNRYVSDQPGFGQAYYDEFTHGVAPGMDGLGTVDMSLVPDALRAAVLNDEDDDEGVGFGIQGYNGYERLGDIYNGQRIGSFEAEPGFGSYQAAPLNTINQQDALAAAAAVARQGGAGFGAYGDADNQFID
jgi:hypothetical protein